MHYSIPSYFLIIDKDDLNCLRKNLKSDEPVFAKLKVGDSTYRINIAYRGSYTREMRKRSYTFYFNEEKKFFDARMIHLNAEYRDPSLMRNKLSFDFFKELKVLAPNSQHIRLFRNDELKGLYLQLESVDDLFLKKRNLPEGPIYYAENNNANFSLTRDGRKKRSRLSGYYQAFGTSTDDQHLREFISKINTTSKFDFPEIILQYLNIDTFLGWLIGAVCTMNNDGFTHNYSLYRNKVTGLYEIMPWDYDGTWGRKISGGVMDHTYVPFEGNKENHLIDLILQVPEFRKMYKEKLEEILETKFTVGFMEDKVMKLHQSIRPDFLLDPYKKHKIDLFDQEPDFIFQFIHKRNEYLKSKIKSYD